jgi:protein-tyrosine phosphatase
MCKRLVCNCLWLGLWWSGVACSPLARTQAPAPPPPRQVLFVCTGNYYRSRFAEALFNHRARAAQLGWRAASRGLGLVSSQHGISPAAQRELSQRGVPQELWQGEPKALTQADLDRSDHIVLLEEAEHRPLLEKQFPKLDCQKLQCWHIPDSGKMKPPTACQAMASSVEELIGKLGR